MTMSILMGSNNFRVFDIKAKITTSSEYISKLFGDNGMTTSKQGQTLPFRLDSIKLDCPVFLTQYEAVPHDLKTCR